MAAAKNRPDLKLSANPVKAIDAFQREALARVGAIAAHGRVTDRGFVTHVAGRPELDRRPRGDKDDENFDRDGRRKDRGERKPRFKVELLCRTFAGDNGSRPLSNVVFWESPDIWIEGPSGDPDVATPGRVNQVKVHIWNLGLADCWAAHVDLYWCDPAVGINAASANPIGSTVIPLMAGQHDIVSFDWTPVMNNGGHECLVAQVYDPVSDPVVAPFNPVQDRHVGQRNVSVVALPAGQTMSFEFFTQNLSLTMAETTLEVQRLEGPALQVVAMALGREAWPVAGQRQVVLTQPENVALQPNPRASPRDRSVPGNASGYAAGRVRTAARLRRSAIACRSGRERRAQDEGARRRARQDESRDADCRRIRETSRREGARSACRAGTRSRPALPNEPSDFVAQKCQARLGRCLPDRRANGRRDYRRRYDRRPGRLERAAPRIRLRMVAP